MPIESGDVKLLRSAIMNDQPEAGGAPTGTVIPDGVSNAIFPDISELDRAGGRVNLRKTFVGIQTDDTDTYFGANVIVAEPPSDPRVSVTLFSTGQTFDTRAQAASRVESYLAAGPEYAGFLFENHIAGQRVIQIFQRPSSPTPNVGQTLYLVQDEGLVSQRAQYVRATAVSRQMRQFFNPATGQDYEAAIVSVDISDALRSDFTGSSANRSFTRATAGTRIRETIVADAGSYVGVVPLTQAASIGDFSIRAQSIFTQLVPSAQTETPLPDIRMNGLTSALVPTGGALTQTITAGFTISTSLFVGGPIYPGSLSIVRDGISVSDEGGRLFSAGSQVGTVDYENGIATLSTNVFGTSSGSHQVTFQPANVPEQISEQLMIRVTPESRSLSYTFVLEQPPLRRSLSISYLAQGRWYVLRDNGSGVIAGSDSTFGAGTINYTTGGVVLTLGALPDVGSALVISFATDARTLDGSNTRLLADRLYVPINTSGQLTESPGPRPIRPNGLMIRWTGAGGVLRQATDDGLGNIWGDAEGRVDYTSGVVYLAPNLLPPPTTIYNLDINTQPEGAVLSSNNVSVNNGLIGATNITPGSVSFDATYRAEWSGFRGAQLAVSSRQMTVRVFDNGSGVLQAFFDSSLRTLGTIDYASGQIELFGAASLSGLPDGAGAVNINGAPTVVVTLLSGSSVTVRWSGLFNRTFTLTRESTTVNVTYSTNATPFSIDVSTPIVTQYQARAFITPGFSMRGVSFSAAGRRYRQLLDNTLVRDTGAGIGASAPEATPAGTVSPSAGLVFVNQWEPHTSGVITNFRAVQAPPTSPPTAPFQTFSTVFRTASAPIRPGSLSVLGTLDDGTTFNVTAGLDGKINGARVKGLVDYEFGLVQLWFVNPAGDPALNIDLSFLQIGGLTTIPLDAARMNSLRYNAVAFSYLPLDANLLGIDPVRLPTDGRVPIFRPGGFAVVGHTGTIGPVTVTNGQTVTSGRVRLSRVRVVDNNGAVINTGFTADLEAGTVTFTDVSTFAQPITIEHRIEDMAVVSQTQINGELTFTRALTHDYPVGAYVSSALIAGDLFARVPLIFDLASWNGSFSDTPGAGAIAQFNSTTYPIAVTNRGAITERWAVRFTNTTSFEVIGENVGVIATGTTATDCAPINPNTGQPYFTIPALGWGAGWSTGNVLRFNTIGAMFPVWVVRTIQQGPETVPDDRFTLLIRGDVDTPATP